jgi:bifunctional non-homologous end joining protein LigD
VADAREELFVEVDGREVRVSHPDKVWFPDDGVTKGDVVDYYLAVGPAMVPHLRARPMNLKRMPDGIVRPGFYQKARPKNAPDWIGSATVAMPSGTPKLELTVDDVASLVWTVNIGVIDFNPWAVTRADLDRPDELRVDLDPDEPYGWEDVRFAALATRELLAEHGLTGFVRTSGGRGMHVTVPIEPVHEFLVVRRAAVALARELERRHPGKVSASWWKEGRNGVFVDFNQNLRDRSLASAYSVRPRPGARVACPLAWDEVPDCELGDFTTATVPARLARLGDPHAGMPEHRGPLESLLEQADRDDAAGLPDAPYPPHFKKMAGEAPRVAPSRARKS